MTLLADYPNLGGSRYRSWGRNIVNEGVRLCPEVL